MECTFSTECTSPLYYDNAGCQCYLWSSPLSTLEYQITVHNGKIRFIWLAKKDNLMLSKYSLQDDIPEIFWSKLACSWSSSSGSVTLNFLSKETNFCFRFLCLAAAAFDFPAPKPRALRPDMSLRVWLTWSSNIGSESEPSSGLEKSSSSSEKISTRSVPSSETLWNKNKKPCIDKGHQDKRLFLQQSWHLSWTALLRILSYLSFPYIGVQM